MLVLADMPPALAPGDLFGALSLTRSDNLITEGSLPRWWHRYPRQKVGQ